MQAVEKTVQMKDRNIMAVFGKFDENIHKIEKALGVVVINRGDEVKITGEEAAVNKAVSILRALDEIAERQPITEHGIDYLISEAGEDEKSISEIKSIGDEAVCMTFSGKRVAPKTLGQKKYVESIRKNTIVFGVGPAGTGKTYLAMAMAINAFKNNEVSRIILTRPAIEAGERLGFLPGDLQQKVDPYLRPLYDALYEIMGAENYLKNLEKGAIEVAPLAYMRGRTLDNAYIVLDEAQNTTSEQMKMFLTRIGYGSKMVITGDITQIDLSGKESGLSSATAILKDIDGIGIVRLSNRDVVRHPLVQRIVTAYDAAELKRKQAGKREG